MSPKNKNNGLWHRLNKQPQTNQKHDITAMSNTNKNNQNNDQSHRPNKEKGTSKNAVEDPSTQHNGATHRPLEENQVNKKSAGANTATKTSGPAKPHRPPKEKKQRRRRRILGSTYEMLDDAQQSQKLTDYSRQNPPNTFHDPSPPSYTNQRNFAQWGPNGLVPPNYGNAGSAYPPHIGGQIDSATLGYFNDENLDPRFVSQKDLEAAQSYEKFQERCRQQTRKTYAKRKQEKKTYVDNAVLERIVGRSLESLDKQGDYMARQGDNMARQGDHMARQGENLKDVIIGLPRAFCRQSEGGNQAVNNTNVANKSEEDELEEGEVREEPDPEPLLDTTLPDSCHPLDILSALEGLGWSQQDLSSVLPQLNGLGWSPRTLKQQFIQDSVTPSQVRNNQRDIDNLDLREALLEGRNEISLDKQSVASLDKDAKLIVLSLNKRYRGWGDDAAHTKRLTDPHAIQKTFLRISSYIDSTFCTKSDESRRQAKDFFRTMLNKRHSAKYRRAISSEREDLVSLLKNQVSEKEATLKTVTTDNTRLQGEVTKLQEQVVDLKQENESALSELSSFKANATKPNDGTKMVGILTKRLDNEKEQTSVLETKVEEDKQTISALETKVEEDKQTISALGTKGKQDKQTISALCTKLEIVEQKSAAFEKDCNFLASELQEEKQTSTGLTMELQEEKQKSAAFENNFNSLASELQEEKQKSAASEMKLQAEKQKLAASEEKATNLDMLLFQERQRVAALEKLYEQERQKNQPRRSARLNKNKK